MFLRYRDIDRDGSGRRVAGTRDKKCVRPAIDNRFVVWQDDRNGGWDIYGFDIVSGRERSIHKGPGDQENPALHGSLVVWQDNRNGDWDIFGYDIRTRKTFPVFVGVGNQTEPDIYGDVVVWTDDRGDDKDIYATRVK
jgi:beta propeller repeat protein